MVLVVDPQSSGEILKVLRQQGEKPFPIGTVQKGGSGVVYDFGAAEGGS
jgi:phosphoribosylaminoimidazole (AIR) synthetase